MTKTLDQIGRLFGEGTVAGLSDGELLERFASRRDGEAFGAIVSRHGPLVLAACRSALGPRDQGEAEDALQATFLILARRAGAFPLHGSLAGWLYRVARRAGRQARVEASRRRAREQVAAGRTRAEPRRDDADRDEIRDLIREEVARLPERDRVPLELCDLHGLTRDEAARAIGCPPGTVAGRLARARERLRARLVRRGVTAPATLGIAAARVDPTSLFRLAARTAIGSTRGETVAGPMARLAASASGGWFGTRLPGGMGSLAAPAMPVVVAAAVLGFGARGGPADPPSPPPAIAATVPPAIEADDPAPVDPDDPAQADRFAGKVVDVDGRPLAGARVYLVPRSPRWTLGSILPEAGVVRAVTGADGRFRFSAKDMTVTSLDGLPARRSGILIAEADGHGPDWAPTWGQHLPTDDLSRREAEKAAEWTLTLPRDVPIRGRLLGPEGRPVAGATVKLLGLSQPTVKDLDGELAKAKAKERPPLGLFDRNEEFLVLGQARVLPGVEGEVVTDADGRFRLAGLGRDRLAWLSIRGAGVVETWGWAITREMPDIRTPDGQGSDNVIHGADFTLALKPGRAVSGVVRDMATGRPLPDAWVGPDEEGILQTATGRSSLASDAQGRFTIEGASPDPKEVFPIYAVPKPGRPHFAGKARFDEAGMAVIDCPAGIPFRLALRDEAGRPVEAEVTYSAIHPNETFSRLFWSRNYGSSTLSRAARQADGSYRGVALPGPGAVMARRPSGVPFRPAFVDPKAFFAPGKADWTAQEKISTYGNPDTLSILYGAGPSVAMQEDYAAIILVNPPDGSKPLELSATVAPPRPRMVTLVDPDGRPVVGATSQGMTFYWSDQEPKLRAATFPLTNLHPDRSRRITFFDEGRKLIGFLMARGDGDAPYVVKLEPWAAVTGRFVDERGGPVVFDGPGPGRSWPVDIGSAVGSLSVAIDDSKVGDFPATRVGVDGRFRVERLVPGQAYTADYSMGGAHGRLLDRATFAPGEVRDLGDIRAPIKAEGKPAPGS